MQILISIFPKFLNSQAHSWKKMETLTKLQNIKNSKK